MFCDITQGILVNPYRRFGTTYHTQHDLSHFVTVCLKLHSQHQLLYTLYIVLAYSLTLAFKHLHMRHLQPKRTLHNVDVIHILNSFS